MPFLRQSGIIPSRRRSVVVTPPSGAPQLVGAYSGDQFTTLIFDRNLVRGTIPTSQFTVNRAGTNISITNAMANDNRVLLTHWGGKVTNNQSVKVSYSGTGIVDKVSGALTAPFSNAAAVTGPATLHSTGTTLNDNTFPGDIGTIVYRGSTATGTPPLVVCCMHDHPPAAETKTQWIEAADKYGLCVALPDGSDGWTTSGGTPYTQSTHADWLRTAIPSWVSNTGADPSKVFLMGWSAGGSITFFSTFLYDNDLLPLAGVGIVCGIGNKSRPSPIVRTSATPIWITLGEGDTNIAINGTTALYSMEEELAIFAGWAGTAGSTEINNSIAGVLNQHYYDGNVQAQTVVNGGHTWFGTDTTDAQLANDLAFNVTDLYAHWVWATVAPLSTGGGGSPTVMARFGMEVGTGPGNGSPFTGLQARNGANTQDINRNFGRGYQIIAGAGDEADTGTAYGRLSLEGVRTVGGVHWYGPQEQYTGTTTSGSTTVTISTTYLAAGMGVSGTGIPAGTVINSVGSGSIVLSAAATATGSRTLTFDRQITSSQLDRAQYIANGSTVVPARPDHSEGWYTFAYRINSWPANVCVPGNSASQGIILMEPAYQGLGAGAVGPMFIKLRDIGGVPKMDINLATGLAVNTSPAYQYNSESGYGFPGGTQPNQDILPAGQVTLGVWHEFIWRVFWSTSATDGELQFWHREKGQPSWTQTYHMNPGIAATLQYTTSPSNYQDNGYEVMTAYRHMVLTTGSESPAWDLEFDSFDNSATSFADAAARFAP